MEIFFWMFNMDVIIAKFKIFMNVNLSKSIQKTNLMHENEW